MSYTAATAPVPHEQRADVNRGIINLIRGGKEPDRQKVFAAYTGKGGLHGLKYSDFKNRYEYTEAKRQIEQGAFYTPDWIVGLIADFLALNKTSSVADLTCGAGAFANHMPREKFFGLELDADAATVAQYLYPEAKIQNGDLRSFQTEQRFDAIVGNPPFALRWSLPNCPMASAAGDASSEDVFLWKSAEALSIGGTLCLVAPATWLNDDILAAKALAFIAQKFERVSEVLLPENAFASTGVEQFGTKIVLLRRFAPGEKPAVSKPAIIDARSISASDILTAWKDACPAYIEFRKRIGGLRSEIAFADQKYGRVEKSHKVTFAYRFFRLLSELQRQDTASALAISSAWEEAHKPAQYDSLGNRLSQITPETVMKRLRRELRQIDVPERHAVRVVVTKNGVSLKTYSRTAAMAVSNAKFDVTRGDIGQGISSVDDVARLIEAAKKAVDVRNDRRSEKDEDAEMVEFEGLNTARFIRRLQKRFAAWENEPDTAAAQQAVEEFYRSHASRGVVIHDKQVSEVARIAAKPGGMISWEMGCGKSLGSLAWDHCKHADDVAHGRKCADGWTLIVTSSLAIELHWKGYLSHFGYTWKQLTTRADWSALSMTKSAPKYLLATHHQVSLYARLIREKTVTGVVRSVIVDESDEFGSRSSNRSRKLLVAGRRAKNKLLLSGTPVRNTAAELYNQLDFLMHGETFFRCVAKIKGVWKHEVRDVVFILNEDINKPYTGRGGFALFKQCHAPSRPTVMGAEKVRPEMPEADTLIDFLGKFRSRIRLTDISGRTPYARSTLGIDLNRAERAEYEELEKNAIRIAREHLKADRSERRASLLSLAHAIHLLQRATSLPAGNIPTKILGSKHQALIDGIAASTASHVAVGVLWKDVVPHLAAAIAKRFPDREVVAFDGEMTFAARRRALDKLNSAKKAVVVTTQQSLRSSLNLPIVGEVFAESLPWNFTVLNQWAMRFCRLTSKATVKVNLMITTGTIEERILGLVIRKEAVARPIAGDDVSEEEQLFAEYGIDAGELDDLAQYLAERDPALRATRENAA